MLGFFCPQTSSSRNLFMMLGAPLGSFRTWGFVYGLLALFCVEVAAAFHPLRLGMGNWHGRKLTIMTMPLEVFVRPMCHFEVCYVSHVQNCLFVFRKVNYLFMSFVVGVPV